MSQHLPTLMFVIDTDTLGGTEKYVLSLASRLTDQYDVSVVCPKFHALDPWVVQLQGFGIRIERDHWRNPFRYSDFLRWWKRFRKVQIVHFVLPCPARSRLTILAAWLARTHVRLATMQLITEVDHRQWWRRLFTTCSVRASLSSLHMIINVSAFDSQRVHKLWRVHQSKLTVIHNAIESERYTPHADGDVNFHQHLVVALIGRLHPQKGHRILLDAVENLLEIVRDFSIIFIGDGPDRSVLEEYVVKKGLSDYVEFLGRRKDIGGILQSVDIVVMPSLAEGFPFVMLEAMAAGKPIIASDLPGIRECIRDGSTGMLIPPTNSSMLHDALLFMIRHQDLAMAMGHSARHHVMQYFNLDGMVEKTKVVYQLSCGADCL
jgi:glycosyltransferase involved in cell wall biosynthesis